MENARPKAMWTRWIVSVVAVLVICGVFCTIVITLGTIFFALALNVTPYPRIIGQNCGEASSYDPDQGEQCLWNAYTTCQTATLVFTFRDIDVGTTHAITVQKQGSTCTLSDAVQGFSIRYRSPVTTYHCTSLTQRNGGLILSGCGGESNIYMPPRPSEQVGHLCGIIQNHRGTVSSGGSVSGIEDCFWQAYTKCMQPATLIYTGDLSAGILSHTLVTQPQGGSCVVSDAEELTVQVTYHICTGLARLSGGGLVARGCGTEGDVTIPPATS